MWRGGTLIIRGFCISFSVIFWSHFLLLELSDYIFNLECSCCGCGLFEFLGASRRLLSTDRTMLEYLPVFRRITTSIILPHSITGRSVAEFAVVHRSSKARAELHCGIHEDVAVQRHPSFYPKDPCPNEKNAGLDAAYRFWTWDLSEVQYTTSLSATAPPQGEDNCKPAKCHSKLTQNKCRVCYQRRSSTAQRFVWLSSSLSQFNIGYSQWYCRWRRHRRWRARGIWRGGWVCCRERRSGCHNGVNREDSEERRTLAFTSPVSLSLAKFRREVLFRDLHPRDFTSPM